MYYKSVAIAFLAAVELVAGHGAIVRAVGNAGGEGQAFGVDDSTPRDGTRRQPFQRDSTRFKGPSRAACGETLEGGSNSIDDGVKSVMEKSGGTLPQVTAGGSVEMTLHQVNGDGAGPYKCFIDESGTGAKWETVAVTRNVPGRRGNSRARATDFPLNVKVPNDVQCKGNINGEDSVCLVRCENDANAGPFGGCVPIQQTKKVKRSTTTAQTPAKSPPQQAKTPAKSIPEDDLMSDPKFIAELRADGEEI